ncbi:hypothetical protein IHQ71_18725 [Rhizobium sp. TH2]|uniref:hypothetical protein n=1 Tax=Rhizobium sp. TH2 TaxID=2775403 RepID=UPI0021579766|nr:hypothetical protein [Rhizobium sp. TH2]UVC07241.1 hypothetical protein IHQ71_18725 [Rhizobium sp. TH2]
MCNNEADRYEIMFDPVAKTAIVLRGQRYTFLAGPFKNYEEARRAAMALSD